MNLIDESKKKYDEEIIKEEKIKKGDENNQIQKISVNKEEKKEIKIKEEDIKKLRMENEKRISSFLSDFIEDNEINKKRANSMMSLRQSKTFSSFTTCDDSICFEEKKGKKFGINLDKLYIDNSEINIRNKRTKEIIEYSKNLYKEILTKKPETRETKQKFGTMIGLQKNIPENLRIIMYPKFQEIEKEEEKNNIEYNNKNNLISIFPDLLLQKIIFDDFMSKNSLIIYHFCQQCFCFLNKEIFFKKIFHCYKIYKNKGIHLDNLENLIDFINILIIEMFKYYEKMNYNEMQINLIKKFYKELITDYIINIKEEENDINENKIEINEIKIDEINISKKLFKFDSFDSNEEKQILYDDSLNKNNLINMNLNFYAKNIKINFNKENHPPHCKIIKTLPKKKIYHKSNKFMNQIEEEITEENNEDDSDSSSNTIKKENCSIEYIHSSSEEEKSASSDLINNLIDKIFKSDKNFVSKKEELLNKINLILSLLEIKDNEIISHQKIEETKTNISFYSDIKLKQKQKSKSVIISGSFAFRRSKTVFGQFNTKQKNNISNNPNIKIDSSSKNYFCITDYNPEDIGIKLTQISISLLDKIHPRELFRGVFLKKEKNETSPNVVKCINNFNKLTYFIIEDIIAYDTPKLRARAYESWVQVCDYCKTNRNYNDCLAIYSALNNYVITGLKLTTKEIKSKTKNLFKTISKFCSVEDNYRTIRNDIINCEQEGKNFIPYLGLLLRDINFVEESYKYINEKGLINIEKIEKMNNLLEKYFKYKKVEKNKIIKKIDKSLNFFEKLEECNITDEILENRADNIEPKFKYKNQGTKTLTDMDKKYFIRKLRKNKTVCVKNDSSFPFK